MDARVQSLGPPEIVRDGHQALTNNGRGSYCQPPPSLRFVAIGVAHTQKSVVEVLVEAEQMIGGDLQANAFARQTFFSELVVQQNLGSAKARCWGYMPRSQTDTGRHEERGSVGVHPTPLIAQP